MLEIREAQLRRLDRPMHRFNVIDRMIAMAQPLEDAEGDQRRDALAVRRQFVDDRARIGFRQGADPIGGMRAEVVHRHRPAMLPRASDDPLCQVAMVEGGPIRQRDALQRVRLGWRSEDLTGARRAPQRHEAVGEAWLVTQRLRATPP